jgi:heat-inducible transcriptional repressor
MNDRRARILRMVAESYIRTAHPVASARIAERLELSSATVRNEFGVLEEQGYLQQPHTSAGRIPTSRGFRSYALGCLPPRRLPERHRSQLVRQLQATNGDGLFALVARAAAELSGYAVVVRLPADEALHILEIHLSMLSAGRLLAVVVLENGIVRQLSVDLAPTPSDSVLDDAERNLRQLTLPLGEVPRALDVIAVNAEEELARTLHAIAGAWPRLNPPRMFSEGLRNLLAEPESSDPEFIRLVVEQVEQVEQVDPASGSWRPDDQPVGLELNESVAQVTAGFELGVGLGSLTVLGPARMRYPSAMMVARGVSEVLSRGLQGA